MVKNPAEARAKLAFRALTPARWHDFDTLFGERGACGGCCCMWWRLTRSEFERNKGAKNKHAMKKLVSSGQVPGIIAYVDGEPVGWCAIQPRASYPALERSRVLKPVDDQPVWSITCFFIARPYRSRGVSSELIKAAIAHAKRKGARIVEGYPVEPKKDRMPDAFAWTGLPTAFKKAGFTEVARRAPTRPIMRCAIK